MAITGTNFVRFTRHGLQAIGRIPGPKQETDLKSADKCSKLRFWELKRHLHVAGMLFDHTYESIKGLPNLGIYELRLDDKIGGQSNIRVVFFDPPSGLAAGRWRNKTSACRLGVGGVAETPERLDE